MVPCMLFKLVYLLNLGCLRFHKKITQESFRIMYFLTLKSQPLTLYIHIQNPKKKCDTLKPSFRWVFNSCSKYLLSAAKMRNNWRDYIKVKEGYENCFTCELLVIILIT